MIGDDEAGRALERVLGRGVVRASLHRDAGLSTTVKLRVIGHQQQLLRVDFERAPGHEVLAAKLDEFERLVDDTDAIVLSDYGKGGLAHVTRMIELAREHGKPVLVDPKGSEYARYRGATLLTPNRGEFREVAGRWADEADLARRAQKLRADLALDALIVTRSEDGHVALHRDGDAARADARARGLRRERRGRHRDRRACAHGGRRRRPGRRHARGQPRRRASSSASWAPPSSTARSSSRASPRNP